MIKHIRHRTVSMASPAVVTAIALGAVVVVVMGAILAHRLGWVPFGPSTNHSSAHSGAPSAPASSISQAETSAGPVVAAVHLVAQDVTPSTHLGLIASGFQGSEPLDVTIKDPEGVVYEEVTMQANGNGRLPSLSLALPQQLASGTYQVVVVGDISHRTAWAPFRMHDVPPAIELQTYTAIPGQTVGFSGSGFIPGEQVQLTLSGVKAPLVSVRSTDAGAVTGNVTIPALAPGSHTLTLIGSVSQTPASVGFNVQGFAPWVVLNHYAITPGQGVGFIGQGFAPGEQVLVYVNSSPRQGTPALRVTADPSGRVVVQDTWVPSGVSGSNELTLVGQTSQASTTAEFTILPGVAPTPSTP